MNTESNQDLEDRLRALSRSFADDPSFTGQVLNRIDAEGVSPGIARSVQLRRYIMRGSIGLAASVLIGVAVWALLLNSPRPAYAVEDMSQRILSLKSIHLKGMISAPDGTSHPVELFAEQPDRCRVNGHLDSGPGGTTSVDEIITAEHQITLDPSNKTATIQSEKPVDARYQVAQILQNEVQLLFGAAQNFTKLRTEKLADIQTDVYQAKVGQQQRIQVWFNPSTGLPVKTALYVAMPDKPEQAVLTFDTIEADPSIDATVFDPKIPEDYKIVRSNPADAPDSGDMILAHLHLAIRYEVNLDKGNVLLCWRLYDDRHPTRDLELPDASNSLAITSMTGTSYTEHLLHADATSQGYHWRWSLLHPDKPTENPATTISMVAKSRSGGTGNHTLTGTHMLSPITFQPKDLAEQIQSLQRQTLPEDQTPMTLEQIEQAVGQ